MLKLNRRKGALGKDTKVGVNSASEDTTVRRYRNSMINMVIII